MEQEGDNGKWFKKKNRGAENKIMDWKWNKEIDRNVLKGQVLVQACKTGKSKQVCQFKPSRLSFMDEKRLNVITLR